MPPDDLPRPPQRPVWLDVRLIDGLKHLAGRQGRSWTQELSRAVEAHLRANDVPPPPEEGES